MISYTLEKIQETLVEVSATLKKQVEIEKQLVKYEMIEKDYGVRLHALENEHKGDGCHTTKELAKRVEINRTDIDKQWIHITTLTDKVTKLWIYGTVAVSIASIIAKIISEHLFK
jgi:hypothetical protein